MMGRKEATSLEDFPALNTGMIVATLQIRGQWAIENDELNMDNNSWRAKGRSDLRNEGGILSGPAASLPFIFLIADCNLLIRSGAQLLSSNDGTFKCFLNCRLVSWSDCDILSSLSLTYWLMKTLALDLISVMVRPLWDIALLGELASGVPLRRWITFHMLGPSELDIVSWRRFFQLSVMASLISLLASRQPSIHSWWFWWILWWRPFRLWILARTCGVIQGLDLLLGLDFPTWVVAAEIWMSLKRETRRDKMGSLGRLVIFDSTSFVKLVQSMLFLGHWADLGMAGL